MMRTLIAFAVAPIAVGLIALIASVFTGKLNEGVWAFGFIAMVAYPTTLVFGVPAYLFLQKFQITSLMSYLGVGFLLALVPIFFLVVLQVLSSSSGGITDLDSLRSSYWLSAIILGAGLFTVLVFWLIARPDQA